MLKKIIGRCLATAAILAAIGGTTILSAQEDDYPADMDDGAAATCSSGTTEVCREFTRTVTSCSQWVPVSINASGSPGTGSLGVTMQCSQPNSTTTKTINHWSK